MQEKARCAGLAELAGRLAGAQMARRCTRCLTEWPDDMQYCPHDGTPLSAPGVETDWDVMLSSVEGMRIRIPQSKVGDRLGAYVLAEQLGEGGMGTVFRATHELLEREVAIKVLLPDFVNRPDIVHRFFKEAQAVNKIRHPNIVDVTDFVEGGDHPPYLVMELLQGVSLARHIHSNAPLKPDVAADIGRDVCDAMAAVHELGIIHRDLKPDNVYLVRRPDGSLKPKLLDFGIAKFMATEEAFLKTRTGELIGTPEYMAPEQIRGLTVDHKVDIYAMGVILYEMLTGRQSFTGLLTELLSKHLHEPPRPPSAVVDSDHPISPGVDEVVLSCLAKKPEERMQTMSQLKEALTWSLEDGHTELVVLSDLPPVPRPRWLWAAAGAALVCLAALLVWVFGFRQDTRAPGSSEKAAASQPALGMEPSGPRAGAGRNGVPARLLKVKSEPAGAAVFRVRDGEYMGRTPTDLQIRRDERATYVVRLEGHEDAKVTLEYTTPSPVHLTLVPWKETGPAAGGRVAVHRQPAPVRKSRKRRRRPRLKPGDWGTVDPFKK